MTLSRATDGVPTSLLAKVFVCAVAIRWSYALVLFAFMGNAGLMGFDSYTYVEYAQQFAAALQRESAHGLEWLGPNPSIMPLFNGLLGFSEFWSGRFGVLAYVLLQGIFDSGTCVLVCLMAQSIDEKYAAAAAWAAVINPTQIVISGLVYPDTPFVFFVALSMLGSLRWLRQPGLAATAIIVVGLSGGALCRILILPWIAIVLILLAGAAALRSRLTMRAAGQLAAIAIIAAICVSPILVRNVEKYGAWSLTSQTGAHLFTVVPWIRQAHDGTPWTKGNEALVALDKERFGTPAPTENPFVLSRRWADLANAEWWTLGLVPTTKAWLYGAFINLAAPAALLSPPVLQIPRTGFYATPGSTIFEKIWNFLFQSESAAYTWILLISGAGLLVIRLIQGIGVIGLMRNALRERARMPVLVLFGLWIGFILAVNGPIASPKYRLPLEPVLNLVTAAGLCSLRSFRTKRTVPGVHA